MTWNLCSWEREEASSQANDLLGFYFYFFLLKEEEEGKKMNVLKGPN